MSANSSETVVSRKLLFSIIYSVQLCVQPLHHKVSKFRSQENAMLFFCILFHSWGSEEGAFLAIQS